MVRTGGPGKCVGMIADENNNYKTKGVPVGLQYVS